MPRRAGIILCLAWEEIARESSWAFKTLSKSSPLKSPVIRQHMARATRGMDGDDVCGWRKAATDWVIMSMLSLLGVYPETYVRRVKNVEKKRESDLVARAITESEDATWSTDRLQTREFSGWKRKVHTTYSIAFATFDSLPSGSRWYRLIGNLCRRIV